MLPNETKIGIIGGGQLGKMLIESSRPWNTKNVVLESREDCPAGLVADKVIEGSIMDGDRIRELAEQCDVLTFEIEHVHVPTLIALEDSGKKVIPSGHVLEIIQDKARQKEFFTKHHLNTAPYFLVQCKKDFEEESELLTGDKFVIKQRTGGYDGKGVLIADKTALASLGDELFDSAVIEQFYPEMVEYAVIVARDTAGNVKSYPLIEMYFNAKSNLVEFLFSPAEASVEIEKKCRDLAMRAIQAMDGVGIFAVELFCTSEGEVLINEIAPRPHNSGHHTIEGCITSQFEQLNRILLGLPLGETDMVCPAAMINLVGPEKQEGTYRLKYTKELMEIPGVYIHLYNKKSIKPHRKMGHITLLAGTMKELKMKAEQVKALMEFTV